MQLNPIRLRRKDTRDTAVAVARHVSRSRCCLKPLASAGHLPAVVRWNSMRLKPAARAPSG
jgi:hypothetical protein